MTAITRFMEANFKHFNARETLAAAKAYKKFVDGGNKMFLAMAGGMSTGEIGISLAKMIRAGKISAVSCTAANLEEDIFNLVGQNTYRQLPDYWDLSPEQEKALYEAGFNRVTDAAIPETVLRPIADVFCDFCAKALADGKRYFPYEVFYHLIESGVWKPHYQIPVENSWVLAACEKKLPIYTPGWEDCTLGNIFTAAVIEGRVKNHQALRMGTEQMEALHRWYRETEKDREIGFFQIGGGIAGDFPICVVPMIIQDLKQDVKFWGYFAQITDATTSYGGYSGAMPNEKITWGKLDVHTPKFTIHSDASLVAPLIFAYVLGE